MRIRTSILIVLITGSSLFAAQSKLLGKIAAFLPNFTEISFITNAINVYKQVENFVIETNKLVKNIKYAQTQWQITSRMLKGMYGEIKNMKDTDVYSLDAWADVFQSAEILTRYEMPEILRGFSMIEYYSVEATGNYLITINTLEQFNLKIQEKQTVTEKYFVSDKYHQAVTLFRTGYDSYTRTTMAFLQSQLTAEMNILATPAADQATKDAAQIRIEDLKTKIQNLDETFNAAYRYQGQVDTIITESTKLIASNLAEIEMTRTRIAQIQQSANNLIEGYRSLERNQKNAVDLPPNTTNPLLSPTGQAYSLDDADKAKPPDQPTNTTPPPSAGTKTSNQDILNLENAANYLLLKQEALNRDILIMKANTFAYITAIEAFKRHSATQQQYQVAMNAYNTFNGK